MKLSKIVIVIAFAGTSGAVLAHSGATGVVKERMDGMSALEKSVKAITPIMRGKDDYDADKVRAFAEDVATHSGEAMTRLFPAGSGGMPSEAKDAVWSDWEEFASLAEDLHRLSEGLGMAADNGIGGVSGAGSASMMGTDTMMGGQTGMMGDASPGAMIGFEELAEMPADAVFTMIAQTCSACHTKYRAESK